MRPSPLRLPACLALLALLSCAAPASSLAAAGDGAVTALSSGESHSVALRDDGTVIAWGRNDLGQLGDGTNNWRYGGTNTIPATPSVVVTADGAPLDKVVRVSAGYHCPLAIRQDGTLWSWGYEGCRSSDTDPVTGSSLVAQPVSRIDGTPLSDVVAAAGGVHHSIAVLDDGTVWTWGVSNLGSGLAASGRAQQVLISAGVPLTGAVHVVSRADRPHVLLASGEVYTWIGTSYATPVELSAGVPLTDATELETGTWHYLVKRADGTMWAWGEGTSGQLGNGASLTQAYPVQVQTSAGVPLMDVVDMAATNDSTFALTSDGSLYAWGWIDGSLTEYATPYAGPGGVSAPVDEVAAGNYQTLIRIGGRAYNRGSNWAGQLADPSGDDSSAWLAVNARPGTATADSAVGSDGAAPASPGVVRDGATRTLLLGSSVIDLDAGQSVTPWVEVVPDGSSFAATCGVDDATTYSGAASTSSGTRANVAVAITGLQDGRSYRWRSCLADAAGAAGPWSSAGSFLLDETAPVVVQASSTIDHSTQTATVTLAGTDSFSGLHDAAAYSFDDGLTWQASATYVRSDLPYGVLVRLLARVRDAAGNVSAATQVDLAAVDTFAPRIRPRTTLRTVGAGGGLDFDISDPETGVASVRATFRGKPVPVRNGTVRGRDLPEGRGVLRILVVDGAGNSASWRRTLAVDRTAPRIANAPHFTFGRSHALRVTDTVTGPTSRTARVVLPRLGVNLVRVRVRDRAGNVAVRRMRIVRHLSLGRPHLNGDLVVRRGDLRFVANRDAIRGSFRFIGHTAPWYARTEHSPALVREAQWRLQQFGFLSKATRLSGELDLTTIRAVQRYQAARGLPTLGTIGPRTRNALDRDLLRARFHRSLLGR